MTDSKAAMFTAKPVTVPARCLSASLPLIRFQGSFTWMYWLPWREMVRILRKASRIRAFSSSW